jgi:hypothetical protein
MTAGGVVGSRSGGCSGVASSAACTLCVACEALHVDQSLLAAEGLAACTVGAHCAWQESELAHRMLLFCCNVAFDELAAAEGFSRAV